MATQGSAEEGEGLRDGEGGGTPTEVYDGPIVFLLGVSELRFPGTSAPPPASWVPHPPEEEVKERTGTPPCKRKSGFPGGPPPDRKGFGLALLPHTWSSFF